MLFSNNNKPLSYCFSLYNMFFSPLIEDIKKSIKVGKKHNELKDIYDIFMSENANEIEYRLNSIKGSEKYKLYKDTVIDMFPFLDFIFFTEFDVEFIDLWPLAGEARSDFYKKIRKNKTIERLDYSYRIWQKSKENQPEIPVGKFKIEYNLNDCIQSVEFSDITDFFTYYDSIYNTEELGLSDNTDYTDIELFKSVLAVIGQNVKVVPVC